MGESNIILDFEYPTSLFFPLNIFLERPISLHMQSHTWDTSSILRTFGITLFQIQLPSWFCFVILFCLRKKESNIILDKAIFHVDKESIHQNSEL